MLLRARISDSTGPRWWRVWTYFAGLALALLGPLIPLASAELRASVAFVGLAALMAGRLLLPRPSVRAADLALSPGVVSVMHAGVLSQRIDATQVRAASTARTAGGVGIALVRRDAGDRPVLLELSTDEDLDRVRQALRIGHTGFGSLTWRSADRPSDILSNVLLVVAAVGWIFVAASAAWMTPIFPWILFLQIPLTAAALFVALLVRASRPAITLGREAVLVAADGARYELPYATIDDVRAADRWLYLRSRSTALDVPMRDAFPEEIDHVVAQIRSASRRARGERPAPPGLPPSTAVLAPRGEPTRAWLERLDATAAALSTPSAYRAAEIEPADLWVALESPDAPADVRAGAARVLARVAPEEARTRIAQVLEGDHDEGAKQRIRIALEDDVEIAARRLDLVDKAVPRKG